MSDDMAVRCGRTVAVIEDDPDIRWLLEEFVQDAGFEVQLYATYDEALMTLATQPVNAIIADCIDCGYLRPTESDRARIAELTGHAPTILHTARPWANDPTITAALDVDSVVPKPTDFSVLLAALEHASRGR